MIFKCNAYSKCKMHHFITWIYVDSVWYRVYDHTPMKYELKKMRNYTSDIFCGYVISLRCVFYSSRSIFGNPLNEYDNIA